MLVLVRFTTEDKETKTLLNDFKIEQVLTQEPIDEDVVRLLAAKMAFDNNAACIETWFCKIYNRKDPVLTKDLQLIRTVG